MIYTEIINRSLKKEFQYKLNSEYPFNENDIRWNTSTSYEFAFIGLLSGVICTCGLDQALIIPSFLFHYRISSRVVFASICLYETITCLCNFFYYLLMSVHVLHLIPMLLLSGIIAIIAAIIGYKIRSFLMRKYEREDLVIMGSYNFTIGISTFIYMIYVLSNLIDDIFKDKSILYKSIS